MGNRSINALLVAVSVLIFCLFIEILLRNFPPLLPSGSFGSAGYDPDIQLRVHRSTLVYNKLRYLKRTPNRDGFMDISHESAKAPGTVRIGFFGDSYVEAIQVPLEDTFFRRIPRMIAGQSVETFGFGFSGWGTLHSLMNYVKQGNSYDLDLVIYVFVKNDPGDNSYAFDDGSGIPLAVLTNTNLGYAIRWGDNHLRSRYARNSLVDRFKQFVSDHSILARVVYSRFGLLVKKYNRGLSQQNHTTDRGEKGTGQLRPNVNDLPSVWPDDLRKETRKLMRNILKHFRDIVLEDGRDFLVLYVPRYQQELEGRLSAEDIWYPWLNATCNALGIPLLNPTQALNKRHAGGVEVYGDHWTSAGHEVIASFLSEYLEHYMSNFIVKKPVPVN